MQWIHKIDPFVVIGGVIAGLAYALPLLTPIAFRDVVVMECWIVFLSGLTTGYFHEKSARACLVTFPLSMLPTLFIVRACNVAHATLVVEGSAMLLFILVGVLSVKLGVLAKRIIPF